MIIFNIILYITIGFIVYFGYQTVLHYHKHENVNFADCKIKLNT